MGSRLQYIYHFSVSSILLLVVHLSTPIPHQLPERQCSANESCSDTECCLALYEEDPYPVCTPRAGEGQRCSQSITIRYRGEPIQLPKVFTEYCPCLYPFKCNGTGDTLYCS